MEGLNKFNGAYFTFLDEIRNSFNVVILYVLLSQQFKFSASGFLYAPNVESQGRR